jgi:hypothetical protein
MLQNIIEEWWTRWNQELWDEWREADEMSIVMRIED